ncbi:hypothetical protein HXX76_013895 [Chlamydomonas incerta]|uniref:DEX1 C-terminal domain-containing protein n=1 Tax=Chlamydomonas incerta TaxID=51695 RepID=A0A835VTV8_CHLIN|nr:hypothetical protein HXX76_013895 [Chlamydomonas incerta]|eukprot:KAG2425141.1 hypothetical protein HXX76_013895 [Chlamydomonas incerta]
MDKEGDIQHEGPVPGASRCGRHRLDLSWMSEATSSVYASPLITDLHADGRRDIIVPSFVHYLEVLEGPNGGQAPGGWPAFHASSVHASPLLYDIDFDGVRDVLLATYDGQVLFYKDTGDKLHEGLQISRLRVRKDWYVGLDPNDPFDHSHPDVGDSDGGRGARGAGGKRAGGGGSGNSEPGSGGGGGGGGAKYASGFKARDGTPFAGGVAVTGMTERVKKFVKQINEYRSKYGDAAADKLMAEAHVTNAVFYEAVLQALKEKDAPSAGAGSATGGGATGGGATGGGVSGGGGGGGGGGGRRRLMAAEGGDGAGGADAAAAGGAFAAGGTATVESAGAGDAVSSEAAASFDIFANAQEQGDLYDGLLGDSAELDAADAEAEERMRAAAGDGDGAEAALAGGDAAGEGGLDSFLDRLQYDEFGDLDATVEYNLATAAAHEHGIDAHAAGDGGDLSGDRYNHLYLGDYVGGGGGGGAAAGLGAKGWADEEFTQSAHPDAAGGSHVYVDPHVMTTPAIADIDGDGHDELVLAVSYFYDREYYDDPEHAKDLKGIDIGKYVASGIAVFDLRTRTEKWVQHLDLSTDATTYKAYAYSSPTLVDLDGDGRLEVVVGTSMGFAYVLDCKGNPLPGWPIQMGEIQAQPLVADINNDGELEVFIADMRGNLAAFSPKGEEVWERHVHSAVSQGAVAGDVDGDGQLEVVLGTASGHVYALAGSTGADIPKWPYRARGRVQAPPTITHLMEGSGLQVLVPAFDGFLYVIDGLQGCADVADLGETSYAAVLVDDIDGDGLLELVATTMNGNVYAFETGAPYHPLKTWTSQVLGPNGQVARYGYVGIAATPATRAARDVAGERLQIQFEVLDKRVAFADNGTLLPGGRGPYNVTVVLKGVGVKEMASGDAPVVGVADSFPGPGRYMVDIPCPRSQASAVVRLEMVDSSGLVYSDEFALSFHMHFHRLLKWAVALPLGLMLAVLAAVAGPAGRTHSA